MERSTNQGFVEEDLGVYLKPTVASLLRYRVVYHQRLVLRLCVFGYVFRHYVDVRYGDLLAGHFVVPVLSREDRHRIHYHLPAPLVFS